MFVRARVPSVWRDVWRVASCECVHAHASSAVVARCVVCCAVCVHACMRVCRVYGACVFELWLDVCAYVHVCHHVALCP